MEIEVPRLAEVDGVLEADERVTRTNGRPPQDRPAPVRDAVSLGFPIVQQLTADLAGDDTALRTFLADPAWNFHLIHLGATFTPQEDARFSRAWITVRLTRDDGIPVP